MKEQRAHRRISRHFLFIIFVVAAFVIGTESAYGLEVEQKSLSLDSSSETLTLRDTGLGTLSCSPDVDFNQVGDYITYKLVLTNKDAENYRIKSITDDNENEHIQLTYEYDTDESDADKEVLITLRYETPSPADKTGFDPMTLIITLASETGEEEGMVGEVNPPNPPDEEEPVPETEESDTGQEDVAPISNDNQPIPNGDEPVAKSDEVRQPDNGQETASGEPSVLPPGKVTDKPTKVEKPQTGDNARPFVVLLLAVLAGGVLLVYAVKKKKFRSIAGMLLFALLATSVPVLTYGAEQTQEVEFVINCENVIVKKVPMSGVLMFHPNDNDNLTFGHSISRSSFESITTVDHMNVPSEAFASWDVSEAQDGTVIAWYTDEDGNGKYELYIGADGDVMANSDSRFVFYHFAGVNEVDMTHLDTSEARNMQAFLNGCSTLKEVDVSPLDTSKVEVLQGFFNGCSSLQTIHGLDAFDTTKVKNTSYMFANCRSLPAVDLSTFDTAKVETMANMFVNCVSLKEVDLSSFNTGNVTNMQNMFANCNTLPKVDLSGFDTENVVYMQSMFNNCDGLTSMDLTNFDTSKVQWMNSMFSDCDNLTHVDLSSFDTGEVRSTASMFYDCDRLQDFSSLHDWDTTNITTMYFMFGMGPQRSKVGNPSIDATFVENWNVSNVTDMTCLFQNVNLKSYLPFKKWDVSKVKSFMDTFNGVHTSTPITSLEGLEDWDVSSATTMDAMFMENSGIKSLDPIKNWNVSSLEITLGMFAYCYQLQDINGLSNWNTVSLKDCSGMFRDASRAGGTIQILSNPTTYTNMFAGAASNASSTGIVVNYSSKTTNIDNIVKAKSGNSKVSKGEMVTLQP